MGEVECYRNREPRVHEASFFVFIHQKIQEVSEGNGAGPRQPSRGVEKFERDLKVAVVLYTQTWLDPRPGPFESQSPP